MRRRALIAVAGGAVLLAGLARSSRAQARRDSGVAQKVDSVMGSKTDEARSRRATATAVGARVDAYRVCVENTSEFEEYVRSLDQGALNKLEWILYSKVLYRTSQPITLLQLCFARNEAHLRPFEREIAKRNTELLARQGVRGTVWLSGFARPDEDSVRTLSVNRASAARSYMAGSPGLSGVAFRTFPGGARLTPPKSAVVAGVRPPVDTGTLTIPIPRHVPLAQLKTVFEPAEWKTTLANAGRELRLETTGRTLDTDIASVDAAVRYEPRAPRANTLVVRYTILWDPNGYRESVRQPMETLKNLLCDAAGATSCPSLPAALSPRTAR
jgi:hypothetical protein